MREVQTFFPFSIVVESSWNVMAHGDAREGKWRGNWRMEWVASTLHTISEHGVSSITTADAHTSPASSRLKWRPRRFKWTHPFRRKTKFGFCACAITFQTQSTYPNYCFKALTFISLFLCYCGLYPLCIPTHCFSDSWQKKYWILGFIHQVRRINIFLPWIGTL